MWTGIKQNKFLFLLLALTAAVAGTIFFISRDTLSKESLQVNLAKRLNLPPVQQMSGVKVVREEDILRVAVSGVTSPTRTLDQYQELLNHMSEQLGKDVRLVLKPSYAEINDMVRGGRVEVAFVCSLAYTEGYNDFGMELLVAPQVKGGSVYYSYLIVPRDSTAVSLQDLQGRSFAFSDPLSNSGQLVPGHQLYLLGEKPASFFSRYTFTYSHDNSISAVANKLVDGAAVDSLVYDHLVATDATIANKTKIIARWGPYGIPPVVVNPNLDPELKVQLQDYFLGLNNLAKGQEILRGLSIDKFVTIQDEAYDGIREMKAELER